MTPTTPNPSADVPTAPVPTVDATVDAAAGRYVAGPARRPRPSIPTPWLVTMVVVLGLVCPNLIIWPLALSDSAGAPFSLVVSLLGFIAVCLGTLVALATCAVTATLHPRRPR